MPIQNRPIAPSFTFFSTIFEFTSAEALLYLLIRLSLGEYSLLSSLQMLFRDGDWFLKYFFSFVNYKCIKIIYFLKNYF
jgi:hypothetical protein